ncbi:MAG: hypothetical protein KDB00_01155 [Planctomycetales bacterium]|nr:hypothetical protein [Planctomycetales bacterium]
MSETDKAESEELAVLECDLVDADDSPESETGSEPVSTAVDPAVVNRVAWRYTLGTAIAILLLGVTINWPLKYVEKSTSNTPRLFSDYQQIETDLPIMAGWPYRYQIRYEATENLPVLKVFSASALMRNVGLILLLMAIVCFYVYRRCVSQPAQSAKRFRISIGDLLVLTVLVAIPFGFWQWLVRSNKQTQQVAALLSRNDCFVGQSSWIPAVLAERLPASVMSKLRTIREVRMENPQDETVTLAATVPTLVSFRVGGGSYDLSDLKPLGQCVHLRDLRISGRAIDAETVRLIASMNRLKTLNLMRTNVTTDAVQALGDLADLRYLHLMHTDVDLASLGSPGWSDTIEMLTLPHPDTGESAEINIEGWPNLSTISITEYDTQLNSKPMKVRLADLPKLKFVELDQFQKFDLQLSNLPSLTSLVGRLLSWEARLPRGGAVPGSTWLERFDGKGLPKLEDFKFFCVDLKSFSLQGPTKISSLGIGVYYRSLDQARQASPYERKLSQESATALIEGLGRSTGPPEVDLDAVPLAGVDLAPLANNQHLMKLLLASSGTKIDQWRGFESMKWLTHLRLSGNEIDSNGIRWVLKSFPNLETLEYGVDPMAMMQRNMGSITFTLNEGDQRLELVGHPNLKTIKREGSQFSFGQSVKIVDMPKLEMEVQVDWPETFEIRNSPMLNGISVSGPLPPNAWIDQQSNLKFLAVGGPNVNDSFAEAILGCQNLETLTLAYPSVSTEVLAKLPLSKVSAIFLPGCAIDDKIVQQWPALESVVHLNLADTEITAASLPKLLAADSLRTLTLDRCPIKQSDLALSGEKSAITELSVAGIGIPADTLKKLLNANELRALNLSDLEVTDEVMSVIANNGSSLQHLTLHNAKFDGKLLAAAANRHRNMSVDIGDSYIDTEIQIAFLNARRLKTRDEWREQVLYEQQIRQQSQPTVYSMGTARYEYKTPGIINVDDFASGGAYSPESLAEMGSGGPMVMGGPSAIRVGTGGPTPTGNQSGSWLGGVIGSLFGGTTVDEEVVMEEQMVVEETVPQDYIPPTEAGNVEEETEEASIDQGTTPGNVEDPK